MIKMLKDNKKVVTGINGCRISAQRKSQLGMQEATTKDSIRGNKQKTFNVPG